MNITLAHGGGGLEMNELIHDVFMLFDDKLLKEANDAAILDDFALSTDSFTIDPIFLKDTNIGKLSVCGSANDVLMVGAKPLYLSLALIIEEGFAMNDLKIILKSIRDECQKQDIRLVCGDTKVLPRQGKKPNIYINTTCMGKLIKPCKISHIKPSQSLIVSRDVGTHGALVLALRNELESDLLSDCKCLKAEVLALLNANIDIACMRDATRGGISAVLNELSSQSGFELLIQEDEVKISQEVEGVCELFGFEPFELANEGCFILSVAKKDEQRALEILKSFNENASIIGEVLKSTQKRVILQNCYGARRVLELPKGELLPRIC